MRDHVVDRVERFAASQRDGAGGEGANEQAAEESGAGGDGNAVDVVPSDLGFGKRFMHDRQYDLDVASGGYLGYDAAVLAVDINLAGHDVAKRVTAVLHHAGGGFVARSFNSEN